ncbi:NAD-dependent epimerase/dehydratase family protein [Halobacillus sp. HZG1]|uniref:NAD-dependent epimerase/dehydratase family protein n=1 Tax=Halobacillus sp. HZG1 TaxID=3111769 RepID=UPI002DB708F3|nr:NAD-dependent epimerase/dehydratase family protein [Halobacillus sp. HZG1]MEC3884017.1 NAD-dependent epimerase/dehydratase family protein [Halobacillus sp. HZG1]
METIEELESVMCTPSEALVEDITKINGDLLILGVGGKMGPTLAKLAKHAIDQAGVQKKVIGVSRFSNETLQEELHEHGIETIAADLLKEEELQALPDIENVIYMAGNKFGTTGNEHFTWAMNAYLPGRVAEKFKNSRIVSFSTGNVYPQTPVGHGGASEEHATGPVGEYGQSVLGRERVFTHFSHKYGTPLLHLRLNYAIDLRYGVLLEVAKAVNEGTPIDLNMGHVNVIWQGDANEVAIRSLLHCDSPPATLNITGPETLSVRWLAERFGEKLHKQPVFTGEEQETALLSNASRAHEVFGYPNIGIRQMLDWTADWVKGQGQVLDKPTHFQERKGQY